MALDIKPIRPAFVCLKAHWPASNESRFEPTPLSMHLNQTSMVESLQRWLRQTTVKKSSVYVYEYSLG